MAQIKSQIKRAATNEKARQHNVAVRSKIATESKKVRVLVEKGDKKAAEAQLKLATKLIDKSVTAGVNTRNTAARKKATLQALVNSMK